MVFLVSNKSIYKKLINKNIYYKPDKTRKSRLVCIKNLLDKHTIQQGSSSSIHQGSSYPGLRAESCVAAMLILHCILLNWLFGGGAEPDYSSGQAWADQVTGTINWGLHTGIRQIYQIQHVGLQIRNRRAKIWWVPNANGIISLPFLLSLWRQVS